MISRKLKIEKKRSSNTKKYHQLKKKIDYPGSERERGKRGKEKKSMRETLGRRDF